MPASLFFTVREEEDQSSFIYMLLLDVFKMKLGGGGCKKSTDVIP